MKIEYFSDGSDQCPLILIYGRDPMGALNLSLALERLAIGLIDEVPNKEEGCKADLCNIHYYTAKGHNVTFYETQMNADQR